MPFPSDWPRRWWLRHGDVAGVLKLPGRLSTDVIFTGDDLSLWSFEIEGHARPIIWDHTASAFASGPEDDPTLNEALRDLMAKLTGRPWTLTPEEQTVVDVIASDFAQTVEVTGKRLRYRLQEEFQINKQRAAYYLERLHGRYVFRINGVGDSYRLTLPGLFSSSGKDEATTAVEWTLSALRLAFKRDQNFHTFGADDVMRAPGFSAETKAFWRHTIARAALGTSYNDDWNFVISPDIEHLVGCTTVRDLWLATAAAGDEAERPWPTAPLRLEETVREQERRARVGETSRPPTRGAGLLEPGQPPQQRVGDTTAGNATSRLAELKEFFKKGVESARQPGPATFRIATINSSYVDPPTGRPMVNVARGPAADAAPATGVTRLKYDVALSFAGEDRAHAEALAKGLKDAGRIVFYDRYEQADLWGVNLPERFHEVYGKSSRFVVMFVSEHYAKKLWTTAERRAAQERAFQEPGRAYILPVIIDHGVEIPGLPFATTGHADIKWGIPEILRMLLDKLNAAPPSP
jgi:hypothetical protein